jgi:hypothetical protein
MSLGTPPCSPILPTKWLPTPHPRCLNMDCNTWSLGLHNLHPGEECRTCSVLPGTGQLQQQCPRIPWLSLIFTDYFPKASSALSPHRETTQTTPPVLIPLSDEFLPGIISCIHFLVLCLLIAPCSWGQGLSANSTYYYLLREQINTCTSYYMSELAKFLWQAVVYSRFFKLHSLFYNYWSPCFGTKTAIDNTQMGMLCSNKTLFTETGSELSFPMQNK